MATLFYLVQISYIVLTSGTKVTVFVEQINKEYKLACKKKKKKKTVMCWMAKNVIIMKIKWL